MLAVIFLCVFRKMLLLLEMRYDTIQMHAALLLTYAHSFQAHAMTTHASAGAGQAMEVRITCHISTITRRYIFLSGCIYPWAPSVR